MNMNKIHFVLIFIENNLYMSFFFTNGILNRRLNYFLNETKNYYKNSSKLQICYIFFLQNENHCNKQQIRSKPMKIILITELRGVKTKVEHRERLLNTENKNTTLLADQTSILSIFILKYIKLNKNLNQFIKIQSKD